MIAISHCRVQPAAAGQHQLVATRTIPAGAPLLAEAPLVTLPVGRYRWGTYNWDLVDLLLSTPEMAQHYDRWKLAVTEFLLDPIDLKVEAALMRKHSLSRQRVRRLFNSIATNNIGMLEPVAQNVVGYGLFEVMSRANHSCRPNARLLPANAGQMALVAMQDVKAGEPVTWSYFRAAEFAGASFADRNFGLANNYRFACTCPRCREERPAALRGEKNLLAFFDAEIMRMARTMSETAEGRAAIVSNTPMEQHRRAIGLSSTTSRGI